MNQNYFTWFIKCDINILATQDFYFRSLEMGVPDKSLASSRLMPTLLVNKNSEIKYSFQISPWHGQNYFVLGVSSMIWAFMTRRILHPVV